jgi:hypothetical protein
VFVEHSQIVYYQYTSTFLSQRVIELVTAYHKRLWWSRGSMPPLSTQVRGFKPGRSHQDFSGRKNPQRAFLRRVSKLSLPHHRFAACKMSLNVMWKLAFRQNYRPTFSPTIPPFAARISRVVWAWRHLAAEVGMSKPPVGWGGGGGGVHIILHAKRSQRQAMCIRWL